MGLQPSEFGRLTRGSASELLSRTERMRAEDAQAIFGFAAECVKVVLKQMADGDRAVVKSLQNVVDVIASRPVL